MNKEKSSISKFFIYGFLVVLFVLIVTFVIIGIKSHKKTIAFYKIPEQVQNSVLKIANEQYNKTFHPLILDDDLPLSSQTKKFKKSHFLVAQNSYDAINLFKKASKKNLISRDLLSGYPASIVDSYNKKTNSSKENLLFLPFLYDFYQIDVNYELFKLSNVPTISTWSDFTTFASAISEKTSAPIIFAGGDDVEFLNTIGIITEALTNSTNYDLLINKFLDCKNDITKIQTLLEEECLPNGLLYNTLVELKSLLSKKIIPSKVFSFSKKDVLFHLDNTLCGAAFLTLSEHRTIDRQVINKYKSIYCPAIDISSIRNFSAPEYVVVPLKKSKKSFDYLNSFAQLQQTKLATETGLCPVQKNCIVPDKQADDVRYWLAASNGPTLPLSSVFSSKENLSYVAEFLRINLRLN